MCMGMSGPPFGIPISEENHQQYSKDLKKAWETFDGWWKTVHRDERGFVKESDMPDKVKSAMTKICNAPIPGYEDMEATGKDSCYMKGVLSSLI